MSPLPCHANAFIAQNPLRRPRMKRCALTTCSRSGRRGRGKSGVVMNLKYLIGAPIGTDYVHHPTIRIVTGDLVQKFGTAVTRVPALTIQECRRVFVPAGTAFKKMRISLRPSMDSMACMALAQSASPSRGLGSCLPSGGDNGRPKEKRCGGPQDAVSFDELRRRGLVTVLGH